MRTRALPEAPGNAAAGREIFYRREAPKCFSCHAIGNEPERAGPNLGDVGARHRKEEILDSLVNPSRVIAEGYEVQILETTSHGLVVGVVARQTPSLLVRNDIGDDIEVSPDAVRSRRESDRSMMPDDLTDSLSDQELLDLLAFLSSLKGPIR